jgi:undecaprenyl-diphosphatase
LFNSKVDVELLAIMTNFGSLVAITFLYKDRILELIKDFFSYLKDDNKKAKYNFRYVILLIIGTIPAGVFGLIVSITDVFDKLEQNIKFVGITLLVTAFLLFLIRNIKGEKSNDKITLKDAIIIGLFQTIAIIPGISRSGSTIVGGMSRNLKRETAFDFSFLLYIPISLATMVLGLKDLFGSSFNTITIVMYLISTLIAGIITYFATKWFRDIVKKGKLIYFVCYCVIVGLLVVIFL